MRDYSGFRQEISPKSKLGKLIRKTALNLRKYSKAKESNVVVKMADQWMGFGSQSIVGRFVVQPKSQSLSFNGTSTLGVKYEYVYGKLTVEHDGVVVQGKLARTLFTLFLNRFNAVYTYLDENFTKAE